MLPSILARIRDSKNKGQFANAYNVPAFLNPCVAADPDFWSFRTCCNFSLAADQLPRRETPKAQELERSAAAGSSPLSPTGVLFNALRRRHLTRVAYASNAPPPDVRIRTRPGPDSVLTESRRANMLRRVATPANSSSIIACQRAFAPGREVLVFCNDTAYRTRRQLKPGSAVRGTGRQRRRSGSAARRRTAR